QLLAKRPYTALVVANRTDAVTRQVRRQHELAIGALASAIEPQHAVPELDRGLGIMPRERPIGELVENRDQHDVKALALVDAPLLVRALQQVAGIEVSCLMKSQRHVGREMRAGNAAGLVAGRFEDGDVDPEAGGHIDLDRLAICRQKVAAAGQQLGDDAPQAPARLTQRLARMRARLLGPERSGQLLAGVRAVVPEQEIGQQVDRAGAEEMRDVTAGAKDDRRSKQRNLERVHAWPRPVNCPMY